MKFKTLLFEGGLDYTTWTMNEWYIVGGAAFLLLAIILFLIFKPKKKGAPNPAKAAKSGKQLVYVSEAGASFLFEGENAWLSNAEGKTELLKAVDGHKVTLSGKVVFFVKDVKHVAVSQDGSVVTRGQSFEKQYVTLDFVSPEELRFGSTVFMTPRLSDELDAKAKADDAKAKKAQEKADKLQATKDEKKAKAQAKADAKAEKEKLAQLEKEEKQRKADEEKADKERKAEAAKAEKERIKEAVRRAKEDARD